MPTSSRLYYAAEYPYGMRRVSFNNGPARVHRTVSAFRTKGERDAWVSAPRADYGRRALDAHELTRSERSRFGR